MMRRAAATSLLLLVLLVPACRSQESADAVSGDAGAEVATMSVAEIPARARELLDADRPWRASLLMRRYVAEVSSAQDAERVLAARAEAGRDEWPRVAELLTPVDDIEQHDDGIGVYLLARAHDEAGNTSAAVTGYRRYLGLEPRSDDRLQHEAARLRLGLALVRAGDAAAARRELDEAESFAGGAAAWLDLLEADALARTGDTAAVREMVAGHRDGIEGLRAWRARIAAAHAAGDNAAARALANQARAWARTDATRSEFFVAAARAAFAMRDSAAARDALRAVVALRSDGVYARQAAALLREGPMSPADHLAVARVLNAQGLQEDAVEGFTRWLDAETGTAAQRQDVQYELADALFYSNRFDDAVTALRPIASEPEARMLLARSEAHRGNADAAARIYLEIADAARGNAVLRPLFLAAGVRHDAGDTARARELYQRVVRRFPGTTQMGLAMMRLAGMSFVAGDHAAAAATWDAYRSRYPRGSNVTQATYWAARARDAMGDSADAAELYRTIRERERDSYYGLRASERLGVPFWPLPMSAAPGTSPAVNSRVRGWMQGLDLLRAAGFDEEASAEADRLVAAAGSDRPTLYSLAEGLIDRGYAQRGIRIGLRLQGGMDRPDERLLRILFPYPYRTLIEDEARARGLDPFVVAALTRQESMFEARITSPAGARGLMQIMPATGRMLAEAAGIEPWDGELLYHPEVNVHLGTRYVARHMKNYEGSLPSVFSAYNAGAHRVEWWSEWPEYGNDELFTERIPFNETRGYVRILTRNMALYRGLYDAGETAPR